MVVVICVIATSVLAAPLSGRHRHCAVKQTPEVNPEKTNPAQQYTFLVSSIGWLWSASQNQDTAEQNECLRQLLPQLWHMVSLILSRHAPYAKLVRGNKRHPTY